ncbi:hypothetical protein [Amaricoccus sp. W119]|uniref:hypothetical protein n=1 Tax=Amaricoccus sp. W119 TaxID=3391833 RepID=UPI0039A49CC5
MPAPSRALLAVLALTASGVSAPAFTSSIVAEMAAVKACSMARASGDYFVLEGWVFTSEELRRLWITIPGEPSALLLAAPQGR